MTAPFFVIVGRVAAFLIVLSTVPGLAEGDDTAGSPMPIVSIPEAEGEPVRLLFIHHSCGGQLLAEPHHRRCWSARRD